MEIDLILKIIIPLLLGVNAYFIKGLVTSITEVRIKMEGMSHKHEALIDKVLGLTTDVKDIYGTINNNRDRLHKLEGASKSIENYIIERLNKKSTDI